MFYAIIQARLSSKRLPHKVLLPIDYSNTSILESVVYRIQKIECLKHNIIVAIPNDEGATLSNFIVSHLPIVSLFLGEQFNVYHRFIEATKHLAHSDFIIRLTADNPFLDYLFLEEAIKIMEDKQYDVLHSQNVPLGMGFEVIQVGILRNIASNYMTNAHKEHVTAYLYENKNDYNIHSYSYSTTRDLSNIRLTVDEPADLKMIQKTFQYFKHNCFTTCDIETLLNSQPNFFDTNKNVYQKLAIESEV